MRKYSVLTAAVASVVLVGGVSSVRAASYASEVSLSGTSLNYFLNQQADDVTLVFNNGASSMDLSTVGAGAQTATVPVGTTKVQLVVTQNDPKAGYVSGPGVVPADQVGATVRLATGAGTDINVRGVAVDNNPASPTFGRVYASLASATASGGIYILNPDLTFPFGNTSQNGGITATAFQSGTSSPFRLTVGNDGYVYIGNFSDASATIYREQESLSQGLINGANVLASIGASSANHSAIASSVLVTGSTANGNLTVYAVDQNVGGSGFDNQLVRWDVGSTVAPDANSDGYAGAPVKLANLIFPTIPGVLADIARGGPDNGFYLMENRSAGLETGIWVLSPTDATTPIWSSLVQSRRFAAEQGDTSNAAADDLTQSRAVDISPDGRFMAVARDDAQTWAIPLLAGIPDLNLRQLIQTGGTATGRDLGFDAVGNIFTAYSGVGGVLVTAPGGKTVAVTGTDGTFTSASQWTATGSGDASATGNWLVGVVPNGSNQAAVFGAVNSAAATVTLPLNTTLGAVTFNSPNSYNLSASAGASLVLAGQGANLSSLAGNHTISAPVSVQTDVGLYAAAGASLTVSGTVTMDPAKLIYVVKNGLGKVTFNGINAGNLDIYAGTLAIQRNGTNSGVTVLNDKVFDAAASGKNGTASALTIAAGATLDLTNNALVYNYQPGIPDAGIGAPVSPLAQVQALIQSGYNGGAWTGSGIITSDGQGHGGIGIGYAEATDLGITTFEGQSLAGPALLVKATFYGDNLLKGNVDLGNDFDLFLTGYLGGGSTWLFGDYNYDGTVDNSDFGLFIDGFKAQGGPLGDLVNVIEGSPLLSSSQKGALLAAVPEPSSIALFGLAACGLVRRRRATK